MAKFSTKAALLAGGVVGVALASPSWAQTTPGDRSGTPTQAGSGQSAASVTQAPSGQAQTPATQADPSNPVTGAAPGASPQTGTPVAPAPRSRSGDSGNGDIIVTARRVEERLQDVPISITVFNQQQLSNRNIVQAQDLSTYTPSLSTDSRFGSNNTTFAIRGFVQDIGTPPSVGVFFADVVAPRAASNNLPTGNGAGPGAFFDLQNVQVLKGPQGTLFGRNTTGGDVLLVPQKPTNQFEGFVEGSYGNYDLKRIQGVVNIPLSDVARLRIGVDHEDRDGFMRNRSGIGPVGYNDIGYTAARASLVLDLTPDLENYTIASYTRSSSHGFGSKVIGAIPGRGGAASMLLEPLAAAQLAREQAAGYGFYDFDTDFTNPKTTIDQWQVINTTTWKATDTLTIKNIASYAQYLIDLQSPVFGTAFDANDAFGGALAPPGSRAQFAASFPLPGGHTAAQNTITEEFQVQGSAFGDKLTYQSGAYYELSQPLGKSGSISPIFAYCQDIYSFQCSTPLAALGAGGASITAATTRFSNVGLYAQGTYAITDHLKLTGGFRYTWDSTRVNAQSINYAFSGTGTTVTTTCSVDSGVPAVVNAAGNANVSPRGALSNQGADCAFRVPTQHSSAPTWLIDLDYKPNDDILLYAKWARGYRSGGVTAQGPDPLREYKQEKVDTYEGGAKFTLRGPIRGTLNVAGFYNDFSNQQVQINVVRPPLSFFTATQTLVRSRIYGGEAEGSLTPFRGFTVDASYAYLNAKVRRINAAPDLTAPEYAGFTISPTLVPGDKLFLTPKHKVSATATYTLPLDEDIGKISLGATFTYTARMVATGASVRSDPTNPFNYIQATKLLNLNLNWASVAGLPIDLAGFVTNVTNKKYYNAINGTLNTVGFELASLAEPRMYGARLRYRFGPGAR